MTETTPNTFDAWCIVELFGHDKIAGRVTEQTIGGSTFVRVDVPEAANVPAYSKFYGPGAIFSITPVSEEIARAVLAHIRPLPVNPFFLPAPAPPSARRDIVDAPDPEFEHDDEDEDER